MALSLTGVPSSSTPSRSTETSPKINPLYGKRPPALTIAAKDVKEKGDKFPPTPETDITASDLPTPSERKRRRRRSRSLRYSSDEEEDQDRILSLNNKLDILISSHQSLASMMTERLTNIEKKLDKLQTDVAFLGSRATEGRPLTAPVYPFGETTIAVQKPPSVGTVSFDIQKSWNDFGL